jgi:hypothetical protein
MFIPYFKKNILGRAIIIVGIIVVVIFLVNIGTTEASRRHLNLDKTMERSMITYRTVEIAGKIFRLYINQDQKSILVKGKVEGWEEKDKVEEHFRMRSPSNFQITYEVDFIH